MRDGNEDSYAAFAPETDVEPGCLSGLLLVADGMGGQQAGDVASRIAAESIRGWAEGLEGDLTRDGRETDALAEQIARAVREASDRVYAYGEAHRAARGLGTTLVMAAFVGDRVLVAHVGDSRCYLIRGTEVSQLTVDHTWVERQAQAGLLPREGLDSHPRAHVLTRSLGSDTAPDVDVTTLRAEPGDIYLLCSDGLTGSVHAEDMLAASNEASSPDKLAQRLVALADERDGSDNITAVVGRATLPSEAVTMNREAAAPPASATRSSRPLALRAAGIAIALAAVAGAYHAGTRAGGQFDVAQDLGALLEEATRQIDAEEPSAAKQSLLEATELLATSGLVKDKSATNSEASPSAQDGEETSESDAPSPVVETTPDVNDEVVSPALTVETTPETRRADDAGEDDSEALAEAAARALGEDADNKPSAVEAAAAAAADTDESDGR